MASTRSATSVRATCALLLALLLGLPGALPAGAAPSSESVAGVRTAKPTILGTLRIPRFGPDYAEQIGEGIGESDVLNHMIGHFPETAAAGAPGNFALAGHRVTYGKPFNLIHTLVLGDEIYVDTPAGTYLYRFRSSEYVDPSAIRVTYPVPHQNVASSPDSILTFVACSPMGSTAERIIAYGVLESFTPAG